MVVLVFQSVLMVLAVRLSRVLNMAAGLEGFVSVCRLSLACIFVPNSIVISVEACRSLILSIVNVTLSDCFMFTTVIVSQPLAPKLKLDLIQDCQITVYPRSVCFIQQLHHNL